MTQTNHFEELMKIKGKVEKRHGLSYIPWANAWQEVKKLYPDTTYKVYTNEKGMPHFIDDFGGFVKVSVTVGGTEQICWLPILDHSYNPMKKEAYKYEKYDKYKNKKVEVEVKAITSFDINKAIMRALTKALALHGYGLFAFQGEDFPQDSKEEPKPHANAPETPPKEKGELHMVCIGCGKNLTENVYKFAMEKHGQSLCFMCQKKKNKGEDYLPKVEEEEVTE